MLYEVERMTFKNQIIFPDGTSLIPDVREALQKGRHKGSYRVEVFGAEHHLIFLLANGSGEQRYLPSVLNFQLPHGSASQDFGESASSTPILFSHITSQQPTVHMTQNQSATNPTTNRREMSSTSPP